MKAFIIFRDRVTYARQCLAALQAAGLDVTVVDHGSSWPGALTWLKECEASGVGVLQRGGGHPKQLWDWGPFQEAAGLSERYVVTDPDVVPALGCPADWLEHLGKILDKWPMPKAGLGLSLDGIPEHYPRRAHVLEWEAQFWQAELADGVYTAAVDTTLALYEPRSLTGTHALDAVRTGPPYVAQHLPWYEDPANLPDDVAYYYEHQEGIAYWTIGGRSAWGN